MLCVARLLLVAAAAVGVVALEQHDPLGGGGAHGVRVQIELLDSRHHDLVRGLLGASVTEFRSRLLSLGLPCMQRRVYVITWRSSEGEGIKTMMLDAGWISPSFLHCSVPSSRRLPVSLFPEMNPSEAVTATSMYGIICWRVGGLDTCMETQMPRCRVRVMHIFLQG